MNDKSIRQSVMDKGEVFWEEKQGEGLLTINLLKDILEKLEELRCCLIDIESAINPR